MEQIRTEAPVQAPPGAPSGVPPVAAPPVPGPGPAAAVPSARGEHVHDDVPVPAAGGRCPPRRHSVRAQVLSALRQALAAGDLAAGQVYSAPALAERHGVSPTPVREAMQRLASEGLVETVPNRGFRVVEHTARDSAELLEVRALLEVPVVLRLGRTQHAATWERTRPFADRTVTAAARGDQAAYAEADRAFHRALLEPAGNRRLVRVAEDLRCRAQAPVRVPAGGARGMPTPGLVSSAAEHVALVDALCSGDLAAVERILRAHLART